MNNIRGFSLVELMVAILVVAIGLLGLAGLQVTGLSSNHNAYLGTQATLLAQDMADRMRANAQGLASYTGTAASSSCGTSCTPAQMAGNDLVQWNQTLAAQLPGGTGAISVASGIYTISVTWTEHQKNSNNASSNISRMVSMSFQP
jgi:type IV pilus assembly protein PilV